MKYENAANLTANVAPAKKYLASAGHNRIGFAVANLKNATMFCTGGESENSETNWAWSYSIADDTWCELTKMNEARFNHGSIALDDKVYAFGGYRRGPGYLSTIEIFDTTMPNDPWDLVRSSAFPKRENPAVCVLGHDQVLIMGGNSFGRLSDVLVFSPKSKTVRKIAEFPQVDV